MTNMTATATIAPISIVDMEAMERLYKASVAANPEGFIQDLDYHGSIIAFAGRVTDVGGCFAVAHCKEGIVGMVALNPDAAMPEQAMMCKLHVSKGCQGCGLGQKLCDFALAEGKRLGFKRVVLDVVTSQKPAIGLYKKNGFVEDRVEMWRGSFKGQDLLYEVMYMYRDL